MRKTICLDKNKYTKKSVYENGQRVLYPENTATEEIYPKAAEPRVAFPVGSTSSEEVLPGQKKQKINPESQKVCYPKGGVSEEKLLEKEEPEANKSSEVNEEPDLNKYFDYGTEDESKANKEPKDKEDPDLNKYFDYGTEDEQVNSETEDEQVNHETESEQVNRETESEHVNYDYIYGLNHAEVLHSINMYLLKRTASTGATLIGATILFKIVKLVNTAFLSLLIKLDTVSSDANTLLYELIPMLSAALLFLAMAIIVLKIVRLCADFAYLRIPAMRVLLQHSNLISDQTKQFMQLIGK